MVTQLHTLNTVIQIHMINIEHNFIEVIKNSSEICFHEDTIIITDQGEVKVKNLTSNHTIEGSKIHIKSQIKPKTCKN